MKINMERLVDFMIDFMETENSYHYDSKKYYQKHGHGVRLDLAKTEEEKRVLYDYKWQEEATYSFYVLRDVFELDKEAVNRLYTASKCVKKWYEKTDYERRLPSDLCKRLESYVFNG